MLQGKLRRSSLKAKLLVSFVIVLILPSIVIGWTSYQQAKTNFNETILQSAEDNVKILNNVINKEIDSKKVDAVYFTKLFNGVSYGTDQLQNVQNRLEEYNKLHPEIEAIYTGLVRDNLFNHRLFKCQMGIILPKEIGIKKQRKKAEKWLSQPHISQVQQGILLLQ